MRAIRFHRAGGPEVLALEDVPEPQPRRGEVRVAVKAAGVNYADVHFRKGEYFVKPQFPDTPGLEVAGTIDALGEGVTGFAIGDRVMTTGARAYAEKMIAPEVNAYAMPDGMSFEDAASLPVQGLTAAHVLSMCARLAPGEKVLAHAAAGGVGSLAVQIAKKRGAFVIGASTKPAKLDAIRALGADVAVCSKDADFVQQVKRAGGADVVLEMIGGSEIYKRNLACLNPFGRMVVYGAASGDLRGAIEPVGLMGKNASVTGYYLTPIIAMRDLCAPVIDELARDVTSGKLRILRDKTFGLGDAAEAHRAMESGAVTGKVVLLV
jgi:NADPH2:quinone reductase